MLNSPSSLFYKASLSIRRNTTTRVSLLEEVQKFIYEHIVVPNMADIKFDDFSSHGRFFSEDKSRKVYVASYVESPDSTMHWAVKINIPDREHARRHWTTHVYLRYSTENDSVRFSFASFYHDYSALCFSNVSQPALNTPEIIVNLLRSSTFDCVDTEYQIPHFSISLDMRTLDSFYDLLFCPERSLPLFVCNGLEGFIDQDELAASVMGNGFAFHVVDVRDVDIINHSLPGELRLPYESIQIYLPVKNETISTRTVSAQRVLSSGVRPTLASIHRGFCASLRNDDRRLHLTVDDIMRIRLSAKYDTQCAELEALKVNNEKIGKENRQLVARLLETEKRYEDAAAIIELDVWHELETQEKRTREKEKALEYIKYQMDVMTDYLFSGVCGDDALQETPSCAELAHLLEALKYRLPCERTAMRRAQ